MSSDVTLRFGDWRQVLADVTCDSLISDPPYSARTHGGPSSRPSVCWCSRRFRGSDMQGRG